MRFQEEVTGSVPGVAASSPGTLLHAVNATSVIGPLDVNVDSGRLLIYSPSLLQQGDQCQSEPRSHLAKGVSLTTSLGQEWQPYCLESRTQWRTTARITTLY